MKNITTLILYCIFILIVGCNQQEGTIDVEPEAFEVELIPANDTLTLSSLFNSFEIIQLDSVYLSDIIDVQRADSVIIVQSKSNNTDLHIFNISGKYLKSLISYGKAYNEAINIQSFCYNKYNKTIDVLCNYGMDIYQYSLENGKLYKKIKLPQKRIFSVADFEILDSLSYMLYKNLGNTQEDEYKLYKYNYIKDEIENEFLKLDKRLAENISIGQRNNLYIKNGNLYFYETFLDGIYKYNCDSLKIEKRILFKPNKFSIPEKILKKNVRDELEFIRTCINCDYIWAHINCIEYKNHIFSFYTYKKTVYGNIIDIKKHQSASYAYIHDDLISHSYLPIGYFRIISSDDKYLICNIESYSTECNNSYIALLNYEL